MELTSGIGASCFLPKNEKQSRGKNFGFTLIELMIVIAIIAILASVLVPNFAKAKDKARMEACKSNLRQIMTAMEMYAGDNNGYYTPCTGTGVAYYIDCPYLIPNYLKAVNYCPLGNSYCIAVNRSAWYEAPANAPIVYCMWNFGGTGTPHQGTDGHYCCPYYWAGGKICEK